MFQNQIAIITGGSSGIGKELARRLLREGASLALVARDLEKLGRVKEELSAGAGGAARVEVYSADVSDESGVKRVTEKIVAELGPPDCLINSAGVLLGEYLEKIPVESYRSLMNINFFGTLHCCRAVLPSFRQRGSGRIINISSVAGILGVFGYAPYCASKHAIVGFTEVLRLELKPQGIQVHLVLPPETDTPMVDEVNRHRPPENKAMCATTPILSVDQVADAVMKGVARGRYLIIPHWRTRFLARTAQVWPGLGRRISDYVVKKNYRGPEG